MVIRSVRAQAWLAEPGSELDGARERAAAGDVDWALWVEEFDRGEATLIDMRVSITVQLDDGSVATVAAENHQVWMHLAEHPPLVTALIAELSGKDFDLLAGRIHKLGATVSVHELAQMYVSVDLCDNLLGVLQPVDQRNARRPEPGVTAGHETEQA